VALNMALFEKEGVEVVGVVLNKILPAKFEYVRDFARRGLARLGIELLGAIPDEPLLANATLGQIRQTSKGRSSTRRRSHGAGSSG
jgi:BioD-like phosphotransacetylase family protein